MPGVERRKNGRRPGDPDDAEGGDRDEPDDHDRAEQPADPVGPEPLNDEQPDQDHHGDRHDVRAKERRHDFETFDGAQHRDRRRDHAVAVEQGGAEDAERDQKRPPDREPRRSTGAPARLGISAVSARMPPSPWLSARITMTTYLIEMTSTSA